ncbi:MAG TPA: hypothetical protein VGC96_00865 [Candidatus Elarobacter sp.]|jgi:hypothetical protein
MIERAEGSCVCGHDRTLHDQHGCAAFLGAFAETARFKRYCPCKRTTEAWQLAAHVLGRARREPLDAKVGHG